MIQIAKELAECIEGMGATLDVEVLSANDDLGLTLDVELISADRLEVIIFHLNWGPERGISSSAGFSFHPSEDPLETLDKLVLTSIESLMSQVQDTLIKSEGLLPYPFG